MFDLAKFLMKGFLDAVGKMPAYKIIMNAAGWYEKGVLTEADLAEIQAAIDAQYQPEAEPTEEPEETTE